MTDKLKVSLQQRIVLYYTRNPKRSDALGHLHGRLGIGIPIQKQSREKVIVNKTHFLRKRSPPKPSSVGFLGR